MMNKGFPGLFKQTGPRGFNYIPRYYDPAKDNADDHRLAGRVTSRRRQSSERQRAGRPDRSLLLLILLVIAVIIYLYARHVAAR